MNPASLIPVADTLTAPNGWFQFFLMLTFPLHLFAMNALLGAGMVTLISHLHPGRAYRDLSHELAKVLPFLVAFTVNLGVAPLLFVNVIYGHLLYTSTVLMGVFWLAVIPLVIIAYYVVYIYDFKFKQLGNFAMFVVLLVLAILLAVAFIFTNNMTLMITPTAWSRWFDKPGGTLLNLGDPTLLARYLHMIIGSLAVGGLFTAWYATTILKHAVEVAEHGRRLGMQLFAWLTLVQLGTGIWFLMTLPQETIRTFMGGDMLATILLIGGSVLALATLLAGFKRLVVPAVWLTIPLVYVMSFMRDIVRGSSLAPFFDPASVPVQVQWSPLVLFLVSLVAGLAVVAWMLLQLMKLKSA